MKIHDLKCDPEPFNAIRAGFKRAEVRLNDRGYCAGDLLLLREKYDSEYVGHDPRNFSAWKRAEVVATELTGQTELVRVTDALAGGQYGIEEGYALLSIERVQIVAAEEAPRG